MTLQWGNRLLIKLKSLIAGSLAIATTDKLNNSYHYFSLIVTV
ncbi:hypothetical protein PLUTE_b0579 [Pseudoalteromonas luteoviolacea DSM 6061]|nr:hypothetical protein [Pseudoalteromonas luteoviolacea DSM 6061]